MKKHLGEDFNVEEYFNDVGAVLLSSEKEFTTRAGENIEGGSSLVDAAASVDEGRVVVSYNVKTQRAKRTTKPSSVLLSPFTALFGSVGRFVSVSNNRKFFRGGFPLDDNYKLEDPVYYSMLVDVNSFVHFGMINDEGTGYVFYFYSPCVSKFVYICLYWVCFIILFGMFVAGKDLRAKRRV